MYIVDQVSQGTGDTHSQKIHLHVENGLNKGDFKNLNREKRKLDF